MQKTQHEAQYPLQKSIPVLLQRSQFREIHSEKMICKPNDNRLRDFLEQALLDNKFVEVKIYREKRTNLQNRYLHFVFKVFGDEFGYTVPEAKDLLKQMFLAYEKSGKSGKVSKFTRSTAELNTKEMTDFIESIRKVASENGCYIPSPSEYTENEINYLNGLC